MYRNGVTLEASKDSSSNEMSYKTIHIESDLYFKMSELAKKRNTNLRKYLNDIIGDVIERQELTERISPFLEIIAVEEKSIVIRDLRDKSKISEVVFSYEDEGKSKVRCLQDESDNCVHVAFAIGFLASNDLGRLFH